MGKCEKIQHRGLSLLTPGQAYDKILAQTLIKMIRVASSDHCQFYNESYYPITRKITPLHPIKIMVASSDHIQPGDHRQIGYRFTLR